MTPEGIYQGIVTGADYGKRGSNGTNSFRINFKCVARRERGQWVPLSEAIDAPVYLYTSERAWEYTEAKLEKLGFNGDFRNPQFDDAAYEKGVVLECRHEDYRGEKQVRWDISFGTTEPADDIDALADKWRKNHPVELSAAKVAARFEGEEIPR